MTYTYWGGAKGRAVLYSHDTRTIEVERYITFLILIIGLISVGFFSVRVMANLQQNTPRPIRQIMSAVTPTANAELAPQGPLLNPSTASSLVRDWSSRNRGTEGVYIAHANGDVLAEQGADEAFFAASLYKLYVAYEGYQQVDKGSVSLDEIYWNGWTRGQCLDEMIRRSHSPCAEKMMAETGKAKIQLGLESYGLTSTKMASLTTSAKDVSLVLGRLWNGTDLSPGSRQAMMDSMAGQQYRSALPKGFKGLQVYNKVGFRDQSEYHDVSLVILPDSQPLIVSVLTKDVGVNSVAKLGETLKNSLEQ